ncbi:MAG TPA: amino acid transporter, partial [Terriglobales bacterium]
MAKNTATEAFPTPMNPQATDQEFSRGLGLFDSVMVVTGVMIGSGIFIVSSEMSRNIGSAGWLL